LPRTLEKSLTTRAPFPNLEKVPLFAETLGTMVESTAGIGLHLTTLAARMDNFMGSIPWGSRPGVCGWGSALGCFDFSERQQLDKQFLIGGVVMGTSRFANLLTIRNVRKVKTTEAQHASLSRRYVHKMMPTPIASEPHFRWPRNPKDMASLVFRIRRTDQDKDRPEGKLAKRSEVQGLSQNELRKLVADLEAAEKDHVYLSRFGDPLITSAERDLFQGFLNLLKHYDDEDRIMRFSMQHADSSRFMHATASGMVQEFAVGVAEKIDEKRRQKMSGVGARQPLASTLFPNKDGPSHRLFTSNERNTRRSFSSADVES
jgi:hypothetical protein